MVKSPKLSNAAAANAADKATLAAIRNQIEASDRQYVGSRRTLYQALGRIFDLTQALVADDRLKQFVLLQRHKWGKVAEGNPFQPLTVLAFNGTRDATAASKYAKVLQYAETEKPSSKSFVDWIESSAGIEQLAALARGASADPLARFEESSDERFERALLALGKQTIGSVSAPKASSIVLPSLYGRALVRQVNGRLEVVGIVPLQDEALKSDIFALVPEEPPRARRKLQDKFLYEIFRLCDLAARWFPKSAVDDTIEDDFVVDSALTGEEIIHALQAAVTKRSENSPTNKARYAQQTALRFRHSGGHWHVDTIGTHPSFPVFQSKITTALDKLDSGTVYLLHARQVLRVVNSFAAMADWTIRVRGPSNPGFDVGGDGEIVFDEFTNDVAWRELAPSLARRKNFSLSRARLHAIGDWFANFKAASKVSKLGRLPKLMALSRTADINIVVPSLNAPDQNGDPVSAAQLEREKSGTLLLTSAHALDEADGDLDDRFFKRSDLINLVEISADYGLDFECRFLEYAEGLSALNVHADEWFVTVPLAISLSGQYAGIVQLLEHKQGSSSAKSSSKAQSRKKGSNA